jgi:HEAT repeat protein
LLICLIASGWLLVSARWSHAEPPAQAKYEPTCKGKTAAEWTTALRDKNPDVRGDAASDLRGAHLDDAEDRDVLVSLIPVLGELLGDEDEIVRANAVDALGHAGEVSRAAIPLLIKAMKDKTCLVRVEAIHAFILLGPSAKDAVQVLTAALTDQDLSANDHLRVMCALRCIGPAARGAIPTIIRIAKGETGKSRRDVLRELSEFGPAAADAVPMLLDMLKGKDREDRAVALEVLCHLGPAAKPTIPEFIKALRDEDKDICLGALSGLADLGPTARPAIPALLEALDSNRQLKVRSGLNGLETSMVPVSARAADVLAQIGMEDKEVVLRLAKAVKGGAIPWRCWLSQRELGPVNNSTITTLADLLKDADPKVRGWAAYTLGRIGPPASKAAPALVGSLKDDDKSVRSAATAALGQIGATTSEVVGGLAGALKDSSADVRCAAAGAFEKLGAKAKPAAPALTAALKDDDAYVRVLAATALYTATGEAERAVPVLVAALESENDSVRGDAIEGLDKIGTAAKAALPALTTAVKDKYDIRAALILYKLRGAEAKEAVPVLVDEASNGGEYCQQARDALKKIDPEAYAKMRRQRGR